MADSILDAIERFRHLPEEADRAASLAINTIAQRSGLKLARDEILKQIAFPRDYLSAERFGVTKFASPSDLHATITARERPTSLARFARGTPIGTKARPGVTVTVARGATRTLNKAWLVKLPQGERGSTDGFNVGMAVRVKPGDKIKNKKGQQTAWLVPNQVALLYGPSIDQVFEQVSGDVAKPISNLLADEFFRQFARTK